MDDTSKTKKNAYDVRVSLSAAAVIELGTWPSPPPRPKTYSTREPTPTRTTRTTRNTREYKSTLFAKQKNIQPNQESSRRHAILKPTEKRCG
jgi:hypothetical protein